MDITLLPIVRPVLVGTMAASLETFKHMALIDFATVGHTQSPNPLAY